jgi:DNA end-binding protein Ku
MLSVEPARLRNLISHTMHVSLSHDEGMAMRSILNTVLEVGLVTVPVKVFAATSSHDRNLHQYHQEDGGRIRYEKICDVEEAPVPADEIRRGHERSDGNLVLLEKADFEELPVSSKLIETLKFVPPEQVDPIYFEKSYYLGPGKDGTKPYIVLRDALAESGLVALVAFTMRERECLATIRPHGDVLVLETMLWADEVRVPEADLPKDAVDASELALAQILIDAKTGDWHPEEYSDEYQKALDELIEAKAEGREAPKAKRERRPKVTSIMDALERSVAEIDPDKLPKPPATARKSAKKAAKRTPRKTAAKKTAKAAAKRDRS